MSKEKLIKGLDEYIDNLYYCLVDDDLDNDIPKEQIEQEKIRLEKLKTIKEELKKIL